MNNEEKEAIEEVKRIIECIEEIYHYDCDTEDEEYLKVVLNYIDKYEKRITFLREEIYGLNKKVKKLQKENEELKKEIDNLIKENHKHIDYIASMKKKQEDKGDTMRIISGLGGNYIAEEIIKRSKDKNIIYMSTDIILDTNCVKELANYIDKLQKENEELKELVGVTTIRIKPEDITMVADNFISKDKIREVLKDIYFYYGQNNDTFLVDKIRKELLGE